jgi:hypothetical protein
MATADTSIPPQFLEVAIKKIKARYVHGHTPTPTTVTAISATAHLSPSET